MYNLIYSFVVQLCIWHFTTDDFKPASVDTSRPAELVVGDKNEVTVTVPNVQVLYEFICCQIPLVAIFKKFNITGKVVFFTKKIRVTG